MGAGGTGDDASAEAVDVGPRGELTYWRGKMQRLQSVHEQLTQPQCKRVVDFLSALSRGSVVAAATAAAAAAINNTSSSSLASSLQTSTDTGNASGMTIDKVKIAGLVQRWKRIDMAVTEAANEAKGKEMATEAIEALLMDSADGRVQGGAAIGSYCLLL